MKVFGRIILVIFGILLLLFGGMAVVGLIANPDFQGEDTQVIHTSIDELWGVLNDVEGLPERRKDIVEVTVSERDNNGNPMLWTETPDMGGYIEFMVEERVEQKKLALKMQKSSFGMTGTWSYELEDLGDSCRVKISEASKIDSWLTRSMMQLAGRDANIQNEFRLLHEHVKK